MSREYVLKGYIETVRKNYDYILIDCMPSLGMMTINALVAADSVIIPSQPSFLSTKGLNLLLHSVSKVKRSINPGLRIDGILLTMVDSRTNNARDIIEALRTGIGQNIRVFETEIPHSVRAAECSLTGESINVVNNLSDFIFGLIRAVGLIILGWGIVQVGMSFQSHDPSQRSNGFLTLAGGIIITFAKEILNLIVG